jgi:hypothetical protein
MDSETGRNVRLGLRSTLGSVRSVSRWTDEPIAEIVPNTASCECARSTPRWSGSRTRTSRATPHLLTSAGQYEYRAPIFVLTRHPPSTQPKEGSGLCSEFESLPPSQLFRTRIPANNSFDPAACRRRCRSIRDRPLCRKQRRAAVILSRECPARCAFCRRIDSTPTE